MTSTKFNQVEGKSYGKCNDCGIVCEDKDAASEHMHSTFKEAQVLGGVRGHSVRTLNPTREQRIRSEVDREINDAITNALDKLDYLVHKGDVTREEITEALKYTPDFADAWEEYSNE